MWVQISWLQDLITNYIEEYTYFQISALFEN